MARKPAQKSKKLAKSRKKSLAWNKKSKSKKSIKKFKSVLFHNLGVFLLFGLSLTFITGYITYKKFSNPLVSAFSSSADDLFSDDVFAVSMYTVDSLDSDIVTTKDVSVVFFDIKSKKIVVYKMPLDLELNVAGRFGEERVDKVLQLGSAIVQNDSSDTGVSLLNTTLQSFFGFPIKRYALVTEENSIDLLGLLSDLDLSFIMGTELNSEVLDSIETNLSNNEIFQILKFANSLPGERMINKELTESYITNSTLLNDEIKDLTFDSNVALEQKSVVVLNGTDVAGIASYGSKVIDNLGARTVLVSNSPTKHDESLLIVDDKNSYTTRALHQFFSNARIISKQEVGDELDVDLNRSDIILILGVDIATAL